MKRTALKLFALSFVISSVFGCASKNEEALFSDIDTAKQNVSSNRNASSNLPVLGNSRFEVIKIAEGQKTNTFVGQKVASFRAELINMQSSIQKHNEDLQRIRTNVIKNSNDYAGSINNVEAKLQKGTTPANPFVVASLQGAQDKIKEMTGEAILTKQLSTRVASDIVMASYITDSIKSSYSVSGAVDEDHAQLKVLQAESERTNVILNNMLDEINNDYTRQQQYIDAANKAVSSLDGPVREGSFAARPTPVLSSPLNSTNLNTVSMNAEKPQDVQSQSGFSSRPLFIVKFNKADVNYKDGLNRVVKGALQAKPDMVFDVVGVTPANASQTDRNAARARATEVFQEMVKAGANPEVVSISAKTSADAKSPEVHIYIK